MNGIRRKLNELEKHVVPDYPTSDTRIDVASMPEAERELHWRARDISERFQHGLNTVLEKAETDVASADAFQDLSESEKTIVLKSHHLLGIRIFKLFCEYMTATHPSDFLKWFFTARLMWFLRDFETFADQSDKEEAIVNDQNLTEEQKNEALEELGKNWVIPWTPETWDPYYKEHVEPTVKASLEKSMREHPELWEEEDLETEAA